MKLRDCPDCKAASGEHHQPGCDVERCPRCGMQAITCNCIYELCGINPATMERDHPDIYRNGPTEAMYQQWDKAWGDRRTRWTGVWPGEAECVEYGWYAKLVAGVGWQSCTADDPEAHPNLNRLVLECVWDVNQQKFVRRS